MLFDVAYSETSLASLASKYAHLLLNTPIPSLFLFFLSFFVGAVHGEKKEVIREYWDNGNLKIEEPYENGFGHGLGTAWYENGSKESEQYYKKGELDGLAIRWHENGNKKSEVHYENGELEGFGTIWYENGNMKVAEFYIDGEREGLQFTWDDRGNIKSDSGT